MIKTVLKIDGMMCGMCEAHVNDLVRSIINVKKVTSSHSKGETVILTEEKPDSDKLIEGITKLGYRVLSVDTIEESEDAPKKKKFSLFHRNK